MGSVLHRNSNSRGASVQYGTATVTLEVPMRITFSEIQIVYYRVYL